MSTFKHSILEAALVGLEARKKGIEAQIAEVRAMLGSRPGQAATTPEATPRTRRKFSAATRRRMKEAQQRRWAKVRGESEPPAQARPEAPKAKRKLSAEGHPRSSEKTLGAKESGRCEGSTRPQEGRHQEGTAGKSGWGWLRRTLPIWLHNAVAPKWRRQRRRLEVKSIPARRAKRKSRPIAKAEEGRGISCRRDMA